MDKGRAGKPQVGALGWLLALAIVAGALQEPAAALTFDPRVTRIDDALVLASLVLSISRLIVSPPPAGLALLLGAWFGAAVVFGLLLAPQPHILTQNEALVVVRQVSLPALLVLLGCLLRPIEVFLLLRIVLVVACINSAYIALEVFGIRIIDPASVAAVRELYVYDGLPGFYRQELPNGFQVTRAGGIFLNPPIAGIAMALGIFSACKIVRSKRYLLLLNLGLAVALLATFSRAGLLIVAIGIIAPVLMRRYGRPASVLGLTLPGAYFGWILIGHEGSAIHFEGLVQGLRDAAGHPFGRGYGYAGNLIYDFGYAESAESLAGIAFSAGGVLAVLVYAWSGAHLARRVSQESRSPESSGPSYGSLALGILAAALFAETAGALNGTMLAWLALGISASSPRESVSRDLRGHSGREEISSNA